MVTHYHYNIGTVNTRGSGIADTRLNGTGNYQTRFVNTDDYRAQEFYMNSNNNINILFEN